MSNSSPNLNHSATNSDIYESMNILREELNQLHQSTMDSSNNIKETKTILEKFNTQVVEVEKGFRRFQENTSKTTDGFTKHHNPPFGVLTPVEYKDLKDILDAKGNILADGAFVTVQRGRLNGQDIVVKRTKYFDTKGRLFCVNRNSDNLFHKNQLFYLVFCSIDLTG